LGLGAAQTPRMPWGLPSRQPKRHLCNWSADTQVGRSSASCPPWFFFDSDNSFFKFTNDDNDDDDDDF